MDKIIGIGNALVDALATIGSDDLLHEIGLPKGGMQPVGAETLERINRIFAHTTRKFTTGGAVCNSVMAMAHLGMRPGVVGMVGRDSFGDFFRKSFREAGVDVRLKDGDLPTGVASTFITPDGQRTFGTYLGAAGAMTPDDLSEETFRGYDILFVEGYLVQNHAFVQRAMELGHAAGMKICLDMASYNIVEADRDFLRLLVDRYVDILFANEDERAPSPVCRSRKPSTTWHAVARLPLSRSGRAAPTSVGVKSRYTSRQRKCPRWWTPMPPETTSLPDSSTATSAGSPC